MIRAGRAPIPPVLDRRGRPTRKRPAGPGRLGVKLRQCWECFCWHEISTGGTQIDEVRCCCVVDAAGRGVQVWKASRPHRGRNG